MEITTGLSALKTATELAGSLRDAAKAGSIKPDELAGRIAEVYDYISDSKEAVLAAQEAVTQLKAENAKLRTYVFHHSVNWRTQSDGIEDGPFCPTCVCEGLDMRLMLNGVADKTGDVLHLLCPKPHVPPGGGRQPSYRIPKTLVPPERYFIQN